MAFSTHHRHLMRCPDFRALHCRLAPPLPHPHIAYVATAKVRRSGGGARGRLVSGYHGFHVAGGGRSAPMRALAGPACLGTSYVSTCNGVVLLAGRPRPTTCVLWNPAVADEEKEVTVPVSARDDCVILGLGYGPRSKTCKLLLTRRQKLRVPTRERYLDRDRDRDLERVPWSPKELLVYALGVAREQPRLRTLLSNGLNGEISGESFYIGGTVYLLHVGESASTILAFDADDETVTIIDLPGEREPWRRRAVPALLVVSGRPCVDVQEDGRGRAVWLLTPEHQWEMRCTIERYRLHRYSIAGAWDCGCVLLMYLHVPRRGDGEDDKLFMYCNETKKKLTERNLSLGFTPEWSDYAFCWGYKPTLVSPGSIVGELDQDGDGERRRDRTADIMAALKPVDKRDRRVGQEATLDTVCFMEFLLRIMRALPENMQDVIGTPLLKPEDSGSGSHSSSDSDSGSGSRSVRDEFYHSD